MAGMGKFVQGRNPPATGQGQMRVPTLSAEEARSLKVGQDGPISNNRDHVQELPVRNSSPLGTNASLTETESDHTDSARPSDSQMRRIFSDTNRSHSRSQRVTSDAWNRPSHRVSGQSTPNAHSQPQPTIAPRQASSIRDVFSYPSTTNGEASEAGFSGSQASTPITPTGGQHGPQQPQGTVRQRAGHDHLTSPRLQIRDAAFDVVTSVVPQNAGPPILSFNVSPAHVNQRPIPGAALASAQTTSNPFWEEVEISSQQQQEHGTRGRQDASHTDNGVEEEARFTDVDYQPHELYTKTFEELEQQSHDDDPNGVDIEWPGDMSGATLETKLEYLMRLDAKHQEKVFESFTKREWESAGQWLNGQLSDVTQQLAECRSKRRGLSRKYEHKVAQRHEAVCADGQTLEATMQEMREKGASLLLSTNAKTKATKAALTTATTTPKTTPPKRKI